MSALFSSEISSYSGFALQLNPQKDYSQLYTLSQELQRILYAAPGTMLTVLTTVDKRHYSVPHSVDHLVWSEQKTMIIVSYTADYSEERRSEDLDALLMWAGHASVGAIPLPLPQALELARGWEEDGTFVSLPYNFSGSYLCGSATLEHSTDNHVMIVNRIWWSGEQETFLATEAYCLNPQPTFSMDKDPLQTRHQILTHLYPCPHWSLPVPTASIALGVDQQGELTLLNLRQGNRITFINSQHESGEWHPFMKDMCFRAQQSGLRSYVATHNPASWIPLRNSLGRHNLTFIEEASEDPGPRQLLLWDYLEPPMNNLVNRYAQVGSVVWTNSPGIDESSPLFPHYVVECQWGNSSHTCMGRLIADRQTRVIRPIHDI